MATLKHRIAKLESNTGGQGRVIVVSVGHGHTPEDVAECLAAKGITTYPQDLVVELRTIYEDRAGNPLASTTPPEFVSVTPKVGR